MADTKITALTAITTVDPAVDVLPIVDVSDTTMAASGTTKKITSNQILGAGGTATLASATITGDLTVDTSTLKVDSANNRVGIGTATPGAPLHILAPGTDTAAIRLAATGGRVFDIGSTAASYGSANNLIIYDITGGAERWRLDSAGVHTWNNVGGVAGTAMTLNSTGLGIGTASVTSGFKLDVVNGDFRVSDAAGADGVEIGWSAGSSQGFVQAYNRNTSAFKPLLLNSSLLVDTSGNVGVGVTPINKLQVAASALAAVPAAGASGHMFAIGSTPYGIAAGALTSGNSYIQATRWDGTATNYDLLLQPNGGNLGFNGLSFGGGSKVIFIGNGTAPSSNPTAGGILYVEAGALKYRGSSGTVTTIAAA
jgi:hypothetical protein